MSAIAHSIELDLAERLRNDPEFRREFFHAEASAKIAEQLISLRKRRGYTQAELAGLARTGQSAISRYERADYQNWTINTLRIITDALNGRLRVVIDAVEDVLVEYESGPARDIATQAVTETEMKRGGVELPSISVRKNELERDEILPPLHKPSDASAEEKRLMGHRKASEQEAVF